MQIKNSVFLVTGGASGLGAATARMAAENGAQGRHRRPAGRERARSWRKELGGRFVKTRRRLGGRRQGGGRARRSRSSAACTCLVNCAGIALAERTRRQGRRRTRSTASARSSTVNLVGTFNMIRLAADAMAKAEPERRPASAA